MKLNQWIALATLGFATTVSANVTVEMFQMNRQIGTLLKADSAAAFHEGVQAFVVAAKKAQDTMPSSLDDDQEKFKGYQVAMQEVIDTALAADKLAAEGKLDEAKATAAKLNQLKKIYHAEYK